MNNLRSYLEYGMNEAESPTNLLGLVAHLKVYGGDTFYYTYYLCVVPTFWDVAENILRDDFDDDADLEKVAKLEDLYGLQDVIWNDYLDDTGVEDIEITVWSGLMPRSQNEQFESIYDVNPYTIAGAIDAMFTNGREIMTKNPGGDRDSLDLIASSVKNDPSKISIYASDKDLVKRIANKAGIPEDKINALIKFTDIKKQI
jgi:hypothetical protein